MHRVFLSIGGNLGDRELLIRQTLEQVKLNVGKVLAESDVYESESWGFSHSIPFLNQVLEVETSLSALCLLDVCNEIEDKLGRNRFNTTDRYAARSVDIDILFFNDEVFKLPPLIVPHRHMHERMFVLEPLSQIASNFKHPLLGKTIEELKSECEDTCKVWNFKMNRKFSVA
jgi:2-amino-4-hydroxy-6-hydroxymethyldihydropteridine diphosphokinase